MRPIWIAAGIVVLPSAGGPGGPGFGPGGSGGTRSRAEIRRRLLHRVILALERRR